MDTWENIDLQVERLLKVYAKHGNIIVATDFDDTVYPYTIKDSNHDKAISLLQECSELGLQITVQTCSLEGRWEMIEDYFTERNIKIFGINCQPEGIPFGGNGKCYYNIILDDRAGLGEAMTILSKFLETIKG